MTGQQALSDASYGSDLSLWELDRADVVVAQDLSDALTVWEGHTGENRQDVTEVRQIPADEHVRIVDEDATDPDTVECPGGGIREMRAAGGVVVDAPAAAWALYSGRGFLCSTEW